MIEDLCSMRLFLFCFSFSDTDPIWRVLASSDRISPWTPLKPQHSNPNPLAYQLWSIDFLTPPHLSSSLPDSLPSLNLMQDGWKALWSIPYVSVASFFPSLNPNFIAYRSSKVSSRSDCIFEIHQCDNQDLVGFIPIAAVAVHLKLKS